MSAAEPDHRSSVQPLVRDLSDWSWRLGAIAAAVLGAVWAAAYLSFIVVPVIVAAMACALPEPVRRRFAAWGLRGTAASMGAFALGVLFITSSLVLAVGEFYGNFDELSDQAVSGVEQVGDWLAKPPFNLDAKGIDDGLARGLDSLKKDPSSALSGTFSVLSTTGGLLAGGLLTLITTLFFKKDRSRMWAATLSLAPRSARGVIDRAGHAAWEVLVGYVQVTLTSAVVDALVIGVAGGIAGVPVAFALGVIVFLFAFIPTVGAILSGTVVVLITLVSQGATTALVMAGIVLAVQQFDANVMYPLLTSRRLSLHPLASLLLVGSGGVLGGLFGAFIAVPVGAMVMATYKVVRDDRAETYVASEGIVPGATDAEG